MSQTNDPAPTVAWLSRSLGILGIACCELQERIASLEPDLINIDLLGVRELAKAGTQIKRGEPQGL